MSRTVNCPCCNISTPVTEDEVGTRILCPRTGGSFRVKRKTSSQGSQPSGPEQKPSLWKTVEDDFDPLPWPAQQAEPAKLKAPRASVETRSKTSPQVIPTAATETKPTASEFHSSPLWRLILTTVMAAFVVAGSVGLLINQLKRSPSPESTRELAAVQSQPVEVIPPTSTSTTTPTQPTTTPASTPVLPLPANPPVGPKPAEVKKADPKSEVVRAIDPKTAEAISADLNPIDSKPADPKPRLDTHGFEVHSLAARLDYLKADEIQKQLQQIREVSLDATGSTKVKNELVKQARTHFNRNELNPGTVVVLKSHPDLAGLPFQIGSEGQLPKERAESMDVLSRQLREVIQTCVREGDSRPNSDKLFRTLMNGVDGKADRKVWTTAESVPCIQQMLQPESREIRRMSCEMLSGLAIPEATEALVKWAVFDADAGNRAAAVAALKDRDRNEVTRVLLSYIRYPWPRAVEHACEALVALDCKESVPQLALAYSLPDPDAPFEVDLPLSSRKTYVREVVRVNHLQNCTMCHPPSFRQNDLIRGAIPDPNQPLPPSLTPAYYNGSSQFVTASVTYLRQDFSMPQPVVNPGKWPEYQRYDYFVAVTPVYVRAAKAPAVGSPYQKALAYAIQKLTAYDPAIDTDWLARQKALAQPLENDNLEAVARFESIKANPNALAAMKLLDTTQSLLRRTTDEILAYVAFWQHLYGETETRLALIAQLAPYARSGDAPVRAKATRMLVAASKPGRLSLAEALSRAARE
jgi:hypothetical protein